MQHNQDSDPGERLPQDALATMEIRLPESLIERLKIQSRGTRLTPATIVQNLVLGHYRWFEDGE